MGAGWLEELEEACLKGGKGKGVGRGERRRGAWGRGAGCRAGSDRWGFEGGGVAGGRASGGGWRVEGWRGERGAAEWGPCVQLEGWSSSVNLNHARGGQSARTSPEEATKYEWFPWSKPM